VAATTAYNISASDDGWDVYYDGSYGLSGSGGIYHMDFSTGTYSKINSYIYSQQPFVSNFGVIWTAWQSWQGRYYSDVIKLGQANLTGPGCGADTTRDYPRAVDSFVFYDRKIGDGDWDLVTYVGDPDAQDTDERCAETALAGCAGNQRDSEFVSFKDKNGQMHPLIVWEDSRTGNWDIYLKDLLTGQEVPVCKCDGDQINPDITLDSDGQPFIVWQDNRNGNWDIYGTRAVTAQALAERYAPELHFKHDINNRGRNDFEPRTVNLMVDAAEKLVLTDGEVPDPSIKDLIDNPGQDNYLDLPGSPANPFHSYADDYKNQLGKEDYSITTYARVVPKAEGTGKTVIQYWFNYYYNNWLNNHEGDWEIFLEPGTQYAFMDTTGSASATIPSVDLSGLYGGWADFAGLWGQKRPLLCLTLFAMTVPQDPPSTATPGISPLPGPTLTSGRGWLTTR
jgi:hypothetical protein